MRVGDKALDLPRLFGLRIANTGRVPILKQDFEGPLTLKLSGDIARLHVTGFSPINLRFLVRETEGDAKSLTIFPAMLNPGDWFEVEVIYDGESSPVALDGRIAGVTSFRDGARATNQPGALLGLGLVLLLMGGVLIAAIVSRDAVVIAMVVSVVLIAAVTERVLSYFNSWRAKRNPLSPAHHRRR